MEIQTFLFDIMILILKQDKTLSVSREVVDQLMFENQIQLLLDFKLGLETDYQVVSGTKLKDDCNLYPILLDLYTPELSLNVVKYCRIGYIVGLLCLTMQFN